MAITSIAVRQPIPQLILSNTARAGATGFLKTLAREVAADGVTVNSLQPGMHDTERVRQLGDRRRRRHPRRRARPARGLRRGRRVPVAPSTPVTSPAPRSRRRRRVRWSAVSATAASAKGARQPTDHGILTVPNLISSAGSRACRCSCGCCSAARTGSPPRSCSPCSARPTGSTGGSRAHFDQGSEVGKVLDPTADRILLVAAGLALLIDGSLPLWVGVVVLAREARDLRGGARAGRRGRSPHGRAVGREGGNTGARCSPCPASCSPTRSSDDPACRCLVVTWIFTIGGLVLSYYAAFTYIPQARGALREGRAAATTERMVRMKAVILAGRRGHQAAAAHEQPAQADDAAGEPADDGARRAAPGASTASTTSS